MLEQLNTAPPDISVNEAAEIAHAYYGVSGQIKCLGGERDRNFLLEHDAPNQCQHILLKISNPTEAEQSIAMQCAALRHLREYSPTVPAQRLIPLANGSEWSAIESVVGQRLFIRAFEYMPGVTLENIEKDSRLMRNIGETCAQLNLGLRAFFHPAAKLPMSWNTQELDQLMALTDYVTEDKTQRLLQNVLDCFVARIKPELPRCRAQVIHNDLTFHNMLVDPRSPYEITGIYDFGDMTYAPLIQDLAVTAAEISAGCDNQLARCAEIIAGFHFVTPLEEVEFSLLPDLMRARLTMACLIESWAAAENHWEDDRTHLKGWRDKAISMLDVFESTGSDAVCSLLKSACGVGVKSIVNSGSEQSQVAGWSRRKKFLGNAEYYSYNSPIHVVRAEGVWLHDKSGKSYLDAYNNVPHVGHCHPKVVAAVAGQTARLNTNTRYLYDALPDYAEKLTATLPEGLEVCYFVSSGSEANDLAWRMAKAWTGNNGGLVLNNAYHGVTDAVFELSPAERRGLEYDCSHVVEINPPDDYRGPWKRDVNNRGQRYAEFCDGAIEQLGINGFQPAAFFMDMIMSTNGIMTAPPGYLEAVFAKVRAAGGLCVADEVQSGFGRLGKAMWGFEVAQGIPDIVTFGKPIAAGYPMGMVVTRREIAERFEQTCEFFSTTGGNPVACAAASAVLDVLQAEKLMDNAVHIGGMLMDGINDLSDSYRCIGDVRGSGLFIGVDLISDAHSLEPAPALATAVVNGMKRRGILIGIDGVEANVLKIRPPMVLNETHCGILLDALDATLKEELSESTISRP